MVYLLWLIFNFYEDYFFDEIDLKISQKISLRLLFVNIFYNDDRSCIMLIDQR